MWDKKNSEQVVVLLQRAQLCLFRSSTGKVVTLPFDPAEVQDLEVINEDSFCKHLVAFIQQQKLTKASVILLLDSTVYFSQKVEIDGDQEKKTQEKTSHQEELPEKLAKPTLLSELENQKKLFAQSVPFANVFSTVVSVGKEKFFLALNRDFYEPVIKVFSEKDLRVVSILPIAVVSPLFGGEFTPQSATTLINALDKYKPHNFLEGSLKAEAPMVSTALPSDPSDKKRLVVMIVLFIVLIGVLVAVILWSRQRDQQLTQPVSPAPLPPVEQPVATPIATPVTATSAATLAELLASTESATADSRIISVAILDASADPSARALLVERLESVGFEFVSVRTAASITGPMIVTFNSTASVEIQQALEMQLDEWGYQARFEEDPEQTESISITLTNQ